MISFLNCCTTNNLINIIIFSVFYTIIFKTIIYCSSGKFYTLFCRSIAVTSYRVHIIHRIEYGTLFEAH